jgi:hypothetical protein
MFSWKKLKGPPKDRRTDWRTSVNIPAMISTSDGSQAPTIVQDLTLDGFRAVIPIGVHQGEILRIRLPTELALSAVVIWTDGDLVGCKFAAPIQTRTFAALVRACV